MLLCFNKHFYKPGAIRKSNVKETSDVDANADVIKTYIARFGFMPEHSFEYFRCHVDEGSPHFIYDDDMGVLCFVSKEGKERVIETLVEPLTQLPKAQAIKRLVEYAIGEKGYGKVILETRREIRDELAKALEGTGYRVLKPRYSLTWPVFIMNNFDETLSGGKWKKIRYFKNKLFRDHAVEVDDFRDSDRETLKELVKSWSRRRTAGDRAYCKSYLRMIDEAFPGFDMAKVIRISGKPVSVFGGWKVVNSDTYYSCIGIYDYDIENLGEVSNVLDLECIKKLGAKKADFGGGEEALTSFKKKFFPDEFYVTDKYAVAKERK